MWLVGEGGIYGCGCKEVYRFPLPTPLVSVLFCSSSIPAFCSLKKKFFVLVTVYTEECRKSDCSEESSWLC